MSDAYEEAENARNASRQAAVEFLRERQMHYQTTFNNPVGEAVLEDMRIFCRADETCVIPGDHDRTLLLEGRREVWLRIQQHLSKLTPEQLLALYSKAPQQE